MKKGHFIVIEGSDSSGKEVQSKLLTKALKKSGHKVKLLDFPKYNNFFGQIVGSYLRGEFGENSQVHPVLGSLPYALDRYESTPEVKKLLEQGYFVVANRYVGSNLAHQSAKLTSRKRKKFIEWAEELEYVRLKTVKEDVTIFLHVPTEKSQELAMNRDEKTYMKGKGKRDIHELDIEYMKNSVKQYLWLSKHRRHWTKLNCMAEGELRSIDSIHKEVIRILKRRKIL